VWDLNYAFADVFGVRKVGWRVLGGRIRHRWKSHDQAIGNSIVCGDCQMTLTDVAVSTHFKYYCQTIFYDNISIGPVIV
jgi:hypothetical protein